MKKLFLNKGLLLAILFLMTAMVSFAQEKVSVNGHDVGGWFKDHWMWVAGGALLLLLILLFSGGGSRRRKTTTVVKDNYGDVKRVITTEEVE